MKLATHITTERGKPITKTANNIIEIELTDNKRPQYKITFQSPNTKDINDFNHITVYDAQKNKIVYANKK